MMYETKEEAKRNHEKPKYFKATKALFTQLNQVRKSLLKLLLFLGYRFAAVFVVYITAMIWTLIKQS